MKLSSYWVGASGLSAAQNAMQVAQQNIANVNTAGYVRQSIILQSNNPVGGITIRSLIGNGVLTKGVDRITNDAITKQYNSQLATVSYYGYQADILAQAESLIGTSALSTALNSYYDAWSQIYNNPVDTNGFNQLISQISSLTSQINQLASRLEGMQSQIRSDLDIQVPELNNLLAQIANVNEQIMAGGANTPNGLLDQRDALIAELSQYAPVEVSYDSSNPNVATVRINGLIAVSDNKFNELGVETDNITGAVIGFTLNGRSMQLNTGVLQATLDNGKYIENYQKQVSDFVDNLVSSYNKVLDDVLEGESFFVVSETGRIEMNSIVSENLNSIQNKLMDEGLLSEIIGLQKESFPKTPMLDEEGNPVLDEEGNPILVSSSNALTMLEQLDKLTLAVASDVSRVNTSLEANQTLFEALQSSKLSIEGVNIDEEYINLMMLQNYYAANSKTIDAMNQLFDTLLALL